MTSAIEHSYLMWVGANHYSTIEEYVEEVIAQGISKRTVNANSAAALMRPNTVVFLAHDEGEYLECDQCTGVIDCPECRKVQTKIEHLTEERDNLDKLPASDSTFVTGDALFGSKKAYGLIRKQKMIDRVEKRIVKRIEKQNNCSECDGIGKVEDKGTGGYVSFNDGTDMDYRQYMYWNRQPEKWNASKHGGMLEMEICEHCGGKGSIPQGRIFGMFIPNKIEYILRPEDGETVKKEMEERGFEVIDAGRLSLEMVRKCGYRKPGGYYITTDPKAPGKDSSETLNKIHDLVEKGLIEDPDAIVKGSFAEFMNTVEIKTKRFRGLKRWSLDPDAEDEADMIIDAIEE